MRLEHATPRYGCQKGTVIGFTSCVVSHCGQQGPLLRGAELTGQFEDGGSGMRSETENSNTARGEYKLVSYHRNLDWKIAPVGRSPVRNEGEFSSVITRTLLSEIRAF